jgi:hypothetical protein
VEDNSKKVIEKSGNEIKDVINPENSNSKMADLQLYHQLLSSYFSEESLEHIKKSIDVPIAKTDIDFVLSLAQAKDRIKLNTNPFEYLPFVGIALIKDLFTSKNTVPVNDCPVTLISCEEDLFTSVRNSLNEFLAGLDASVSILDKEALSSSENHNNKSNIVYVGTSSVLATFINSEVGRASNIQRICFFSPQDTDIDSAKLLIVEASKRWKRPHYVVIAPELSDQYKELVKLHFKSDTHVAQHKIIDISSKDINRYNILADCIEVYAKPTLVFCRNIPEINHISYVLSSLSIQSEKLLGRLSPLKASSIYKSLQTERYSVVLATDYSASGLELNDFKSVINFGVPSEPEVYVNRTLSAEPDCEIITITTSKNAADLFYLRKVTDIEFITMAQPSAEELVANSLNSLIKKATAHVQDTFKSDISTARVNLLAQAVKVSTDSEKIISYLLLCNEQRVHQLSPSRSKPVTHDTDSSQTNSDYSRKPESSARTNSRETNNQESKSAYLASRNSNSRFKSDNTNRTSTRNGDNQISQNNYERHPSEDYEDIEPSRSQSVIKEVYESVSRIYLGLGSSNGISSSSFEELKLEDENIIQRVSIRNNYSFIDVLLPHTDKAVELLQSHLAKESTKYSKEDILVKQAIVIPGGIIMKSSEDEQQVEQTDKIDTEEYSDAEV